MRHLAEGRSEALKILHAELAHALGPERFQREIRLAARLIMADVGSTARQAAGLAS